MNDDDIDNIIIRFLENDISEEEKSYCLNWLMLSNENSSHLKKMVNVWESTRMYNSIQNTKSIKKIYSKRKTILSSLHYQITTLAAVLIVCILSITYVSLTNKTVYKTVFSQNNKKLITLPDNSKVWLNAHSSIRYPTKFNEKRRVVTLKGEAFFDVTENSDFPFIVSTDNIKIKVLGTRFLVKESISSDEVITVLESGSISFTTILNSREYILEPNEKITYNESRDLINVEKININNYLAWLDNRLIFENTPIEIVFDRLSQWYNVDIILNNEAIKTIPVSFIVDEEPLDEVLKTLQIIAPFEYEHINNRILIK